MKQKLFTLLTLLVLCVTGAWADTENVVTTYTYSSGAVASLASNDYFSAASTPTVTANGSFASKNSGLQTNVTKGTSATVTFAFTAKASVKVSSFTFNSCTGSNAITSASVDYYKNSETPTHVNVTFTKSTFTDDQVTISPEMTLAKDEIFTVKVNLTNTDASNNRDWQLKTITLEASPGAPSTSVVVNAEKKDQTSYLDNSGAISGSKTEPYVAYTMSYTGVPLKVVCTTAENNENIQAGSDNYKFTISGNDYTAFKVSKGRTYTIEPLNGAVINTVTAYGSSNSDKTSQISTYDGTSHELAARGTSGTPVTTTGFSLAKNASGKFEFTIGGNASQAIVVLVVIYDTPEIVDLTVSSAGYATLYYDKKLAIPAGVTAYSATVSGSNIVLTGVDDVIPANTGVILKGDPGTYNFVVTTATAPTISENILTGTTSATTKAALGGTVYTLGQNGEGVVGLRSYTGNDIRAYSAYSTSISLAARDFYAFDEDVTAINKVEAKKVENGVYYNLAGQQVAQPSKGLYIVNGKKVVLK